MKLEYIIDYVQSALDDQSVHYTQSGVSAAINEANEIVAVTSLYYERTSNDWAPGPAATGDLFLTLPPDCIVPIHVRDSVTRSRISPVKVSHLRIEDSTWWSTYSTSAQGYKYYSIWNPMRIATNGTTHDDRFSMILYPRVKSATLQISMTYAAVPPTLSTNADHSRIPEGHDLTLGDFAVFCGLMRRKVSLETSMEWLKKFFAGIGKINTSMRRRYPRGRDFEPQPIEQIIERVSPAFTRKKDGNRNRTNRRNR